MGLCFFDSSDLLFVLYQNERVIDTDSEGWKGNSATSEPLKGSQVSHTVRINKIVRVIPREVRN